MYKYFILSMRTHILMYVTQKKKDLLKQVN